VQSETRWSARSWPPAPEVLPTIVGAHRATRNALHRQQDVTFREDAARNRQDDGPDSIADLRRRAPDLARRDTSKISLSVKPKRAGWDDDLILSLLMQLQARKAKRDALVHEVAMTVKVRKQQHASAVTTLRLSAIRPGTSSAASSSAPLSAATLASVRCQAGGIGRDHHPGPRALPRPPWPWSRAPRSALPSMAMTSPSPLPSRAGQRRDPGQHPTEDRTQRLLIDHPEHRRIDVMQRYRLPKLQ